MNERASSADVEGVFEPFHISRVQWEEFSHGERFGMRFQQLGAFGGGSQISVCMEVLPPRKQASGAFQHAGRRARIHSRRRSDAAAWRQILRAVRGALRVLPPGQKVGHALVNRSTEPCRYLVLGNPHPNDVVVFPDTGRVSVRLTGESYRKAATMEYCEGVDVDAAV